MEFHGDMVAVTTISNISAEHRPYVWNFDDRKTSLESTHHLVDGRWEIDTNFVNLNYF